MFWASNTKTTILSHANVTGTGGNSTAVDTSTAEGDILLILTNRASGTGDVTVVVAESETATGTYTPVPADALYNLNTGKDEAFDALGTTASTQTIALKSNRVKRFVRFQFSGSSLNQNIVAIAVATRKYTEEEV